MEDPKGVVEEIRVTKFDVGTARKNPLAIDTHEAIRQLAAGIYQKDLHFIMELVQNADDNDYTEGEVPGLEFVLVEEDIAGVGVEWTLLVLNNEIGFSRANIESLCSIGRSTKQGRRDHGYIGEKGIGFKSVFLVTQHPIVISNGYRIRFNDCPTDDTDLGFIVPEWAEQPTDTDLSNCLGISKEKLPNTIIVLPIRRDKVQVMQEQLFQLSPQLVLFLNKIDRLSAQQLRRRGLAETSNERNCMSVQRHRCSPSPEISRMVPNNCSYFMVRLASPAREATFHVWQQEFPAEVDHEVDDRRYIHAWTITLAFPLERRADDSSEPNLYAFLPMKVATGLPFIINADFLLVSSRDAIRFDSRWNRGILRCIPQAFISAFMFFLRSSELSSATTSLQDVYHYIPLAHLNVWELTLVRETILQRIRVQSSILCEKNVGQQFPARANSDPHSWFLCQPSQARTIDPKFRLLLEEAHSVNVSPPQLLTIQRLYIVDADVQNQYEKDLVKPELLGDLPLVKYIDEENKVRLLAPCDKDAVSVHISKKHKDMPILSQWTPIFQRWVSVRFMPNSTVKTANSVAKDKFLPLCEWLKRVAGVNQLSVKSYAMKLVTLCKEVPKDDASLALGTMHFIFHAIHDGYLSEDKCGSIFAELPLVDQSGKIYSKFKGSILLPASVCKWPRFLLHDSWKCHILCLSESYLELPPFMKDEVGADLVTQFLRETVKAVDIFDIENPPDAPFHIPSPWGLAASDVKAFLTWLKGLSNIPLKLKASFKESDWVKTMEHGDQKPSMSFLDLGQWNNVLTSRDVPFVDARFYGDLRPFSSILNELGVVTKLEEGARAVAEHVQKLSTTGALEVPIDMASRWYKNLRMNNWMGWRSKNMPVIWVPNGQQGCFLGSWKSPHECVISDKGGLFHNRLCVLDRFYTDEVVLTFFKDNVGVSATPGTEKHCQLWVDWGERKETVGKEDCQNTWCIIAEGWESFVEKASWEFHVFLKRCRIPCEPFQSGDGSDALLQLARPSEALYGDNLILAEAFHEAFPSLKFAWYPRCADATPWVDKLVKCYLDLGVKRLSHVLVGEPAVYTSRINGLPELCWKGSIGRGLYRAILGYLADPKHMLSADARKRMVLQLRNVEVWHVDEVGEVEYKLSLGGKVYAACRAKSVRWEKGEKRIYVAMPGRCNKAQVAHELASELAKGVVGGERVLLAEGLQDLLLLASGVCFEDDAVQYLLCVRNLRLTLEDEALLYEQPLETETTHFF
ncbi:hypothetical protein GOP47_0022826 [Adiantum capillus-veneris]|uniref:Sacsin/Nov domain-containing protein n=1 Tax=Adiantum capillus-veneris TaxID=13818 RepID=A0A9D4Z6C8_ADICA|nr:hypothetical protein GOP47_0022826 [Adiantum capillus-veneris]